MAPAKDLRESSGPSASELSEYDLPRAVAGRIRPRSWSVAVATIAAMVLCTAFAWATLIVFAPSSDIADEAAFTLVEVSAGEVGASISLNTVAAWAPTPVGSNLAAGTVTSVLLTPGQEVGVGAVLYTVNLRPVVVAQGQTPAFRPLSRGIEGADVAQLQSMLASLGLYAHEIDGVFDWATEQAVESWQESLGLSADGTVQAGDVIFVPTLPARVSLDADVVARGAQLSGGEVVVLGLPSTPAFTMPVSASQSVLIPDGTRVEIIGPQGQSWEGFVSERFAQEQSQTIDVVLTGRDGASICGDQCAAVQVEDQSLLKSRVITVETVAGLVLPSAALLSTADGSIVVVDESGTEHSVSVIASAKGMSVVEGVGAGLMVRLPPAEQQ